MFPPPSREGRAKPGPAEAAPVVRHFIFGCMDLTPLYINSRWENCFVHIKLPPCPQKKTEAAPSGWPPAVKGTGETELAGNLLPLAPATGLSSIISVSSSGATALTLIFAVPTSRPAPW